MPARKVVVSWGTGIGGAGLSVFYSLEATDITASLGTFFTAIAGVFPTVVTWSIPSSGDIIDIPTGKITGAWSGGTAANITATGGAAYVAGTGAMVRWQCTQVIDGRRVKGRTFLVPLLTTAFDTTGTITNANVTTLSNAAAALAGTGTLQIYHRPTKLSPGTGALANVTGSSVPDKVVSIRSRRT